MSRSCSTSTPTLRLDRASKARSPECARLKSKSGWEASRRLGPSAVRVVEGQAGGIAVETETQHAPQRGPRGDESPAVDLEHEAGGALPLGGGQQVEVIRRGRPRRGGRERREPRLDGEVLWSTSGRQPRSRPRPLSASSTPRACSRIRGGSGDGVGGTREQAMHGGAPIGIVLSPDPAAVGGDDRARDREPRPRPSAFVVTNGSKRCSRRAGECRFRDHAPRSARSPRRSARYEDSGSVGIGVGAHRLASVQDEVQQHLLQLHSVSPHGRKIGFQRRPSGRRGA